MKRILVLLPILALAFVALPVYAQGSLPCTPTPNGNGAATCTAHPGAVTATMTVTPITCPDGSIVPGGVLTLNVVNQVFHITINTAGDVWDTGTREGTLTFVASPSGVTYTGHFATWFGESINLNNVVFHFTANFEATATDGTTLSVHLVGHISFSATGTENIFFTATC